METRRPQRFQRQIDWYTAGLLVALLALSAGTATAQQKTLRVGIKQVSPFVIKGANDNYSGISIELWEEIAQNLDVDFQYVEMDNTNQLIEACENKELDLAIAAITMTSDRLKRVDFSNTMFNSSVSIVVPSRRPGMMDTLLYFFNSWLLNVLLTLAIILVVIGTIIWLVETRRNPEFPRDPIHGIGQGIWWASVTMTGVGYGDTVPRSLLGRLLGVVWMFIGVLMISSFTATIASSLTSENIRSQVSGLVDLGRVKVGAVEGENPITLLRREGIIAQGYKTLGQALEELANGNLDAVVHDQPIIQYLIRESPELSSSIGISSISLRKEEYGIAVGMPVDPNQRNTLVDEVNASLIQVKSSGRYDEILGQYLGS